MVKKKISRRSLNHFLQLFLNHFFKLYANKSGRPQKMVSENALKVLMEYDWPGNIREIQNLVERLCTIKQDLVIRVKDIASFSISKKKITDSTLNEAVSSFEKQYIAEVLEMVDGNRKKHRKNSAFIATHSLQKFMNTV